MMTNDAADGIDLLLQPWRHLAAQLSPLIGDSGFCALYGRSARLASTRFGWLMPMQSGKSIDGLLVAMRALYAAAGHSEATQANDAILLTFTKLLTGLIGRALTMQLLDAAPAGGNASKPVQEQQ
jgi:hypothetical protein